jgi:hypothetical protein
VLSSFVKIRGMKAVSLDRLRLSHAYFSVSVYCLATPMMRLTMLSARPHCLGSSCEDTKWGFTASAAALPANWRASEKDCKVTQYTTYAKRRDVVQCAERVFDVEDARTSTREHDELWLWARSGLFTFLR